jgi:Domain of unknown function (DUF4252)
MKQALWIGLLAFATVVPIAAQTIKIPESWDKLAAKANEVVNVNLDKGMLQSASKFMDNPDGEKEKQLLSKLNGIYVRSLEFKTPGEFTEADVEPIRAQLQGPEWTHLVDISDKSTKESVIVYLKRVNDQPMGMVVLVEEPTELTFVNLDGQISLDDLDALSGNFGVPQGIYAAAHGKPAAEKSKESKSDKK